MRIRTCSKAAAAAFVLATCLPVMTKGLTSSDRGRNGADVRRPTPPLSSTTITELKNESTRKRKRKRRLPTAPLVDSSLLRFISEQKRQQVKQWSKEKDGNDSTIVSLIMENVSDDEKNQSNTLLVSKSRMEESIPPTAAVINHETNATLKNNAEPEGSMPLSTEILSETVARGLRTKDSLEGWMGQYNRNRVAQTLVSMGADEEAALKAGEKVQNHVLARTVRRRIRSFLKERDSLWSRLSDDTASTTAQLVENNILQSDIAHPTYGFDDIVEVLIEYGLNGKDICTILTHSPSIAMMMPRKSFREVNTVDEEDYDEDDENSLVSSSGETLEETVNRSLVNLLQTTLGYRKYDARKVLRGCPGLLSMKGSKSAVQIVEIMTKVGVSKNAIARDKRALPGLLSRSPAGLFRLISFLSSDKVRMPITSIGPLIRRPACRELLDAVTPVPRLRQLSESEQDGEDATIDPNLQTALSGKSRDERVRQVNDVYKNMAATVHALKSDIGTKDLTKVILAYPSVLLQNAEEQILPTASYLVEELGIDEDGLPNVLQQYPMLLGKDVEQMDQVAAFLVYLGIKEADLGSIFRAFPAILSMDVEKEMTPVIEFLIEVGVADLGKFVQVLPAVLGYSIEDDLRPKWDYLQKVCLQPVFEINKFPGYFSYPFERVIRTRYDYLAAKGIARQLLPVDAVLRFGDDDFATRIARDTDGGKVFRVFANKRKQALAKIGGKAAKKTRSRSKKLTTLKKQ